ncbi:hypothetical protein ANCCAN_10220 [Ancylostoma caninum]|uniref:Uncharacterized protein n=1 Tax=Ancylostoma caninum TaxID=29170 RepID=A0A368GJ81_ANCCA|nr:hypothetical protein ANCCAN_10220 [Ancylostoma caninum]
MEIHVAASYFVGMSGIPPRRPRDEQQPSTSGTHRDPGRKSKKKRSGMKKEVLVPNTAHVACKCGKPFEQVSVGRSEEGITVSVFQFQPLKISVNAYFLQLW